MKPRSPHTVLYLDLLSFAEETLAHHDNRYKGAKGMGATNIDYYVKKVNCAKILVKMLRKGLPGKQTDFLALFNEVK